MGTDTFPTNLRNPNNLHLEDLINDCNVDKPNYSNRYLKFLAFKQKTRNNRRAFQKLVKSAQKKEIVLGRKESPYFSPSRPQETVHNHISKYKKWAHKNLDNNSTSYTPTR